MALTNDQLLERIVIIETKLNEIQTALNNLVSRKQMKALAQLRQSEIEELKTKVATLESQVAVLQG